jgi:hypothetical protein
MTFTTLVDFRDEKWSSYAQCFTWNIVLTRV